MEEILTGDSNHLFHAKLIVLSYHMFTIKPDEYQYSRTYEQFNNDIRTKTYDLITFDDGDESIITACEILDIMNLRAKLFITTSLIGKKGYCSWDELDIISLTHDIENHSHEHIDLRNLDNDGIMYQIKKASEMIEDNIGKKPRYFVPPFNKANKHVQNCAEKCGLQLVNNRIDVLNSTP